MTYHHILLFKYCQKYNLVLPCYTSRNRRWNSSSDGSRLEFHPLRPLDRPRSGGLHVALVRFKRDVRLPSAAPSAVNSLYAAVYSPPQQRGARRYNIKLQEEDAGGLPESAIHRSRESPWHFCIIAAAYNLVQMRNLGLGTG